MNDLDLMEASTVLAALRHYLRNHRKRVRTASNVAEEADAQAAYEKIKAHRDALLARQVGPTT